MHGDIAAGPPFFGGTPSDQTVREAIRYLRANGKRVMLYPFIMMDVPPGNTLPDPYSDNAGKLGQPAFPWRGRITCSPAPGFAGSPDKTAAAKAQIDTLFLREDGGMRAFILHYAKLAEEEGADAFCIGSELVGLTGVRSGPGAGPYPAVDHLCQLADLVRAEFRGQDRLCRRLERVPLAPARRRLGRRDLQSRQALGAGEHRFCRHRQLPAALGLARRQLAPRLRPRGRRGHHLRPGLSALEHRGRRVLRLVLRRANGRATTSCARP